MAIVGLKHEQQAFDRLGPHYQALARAMGRRTIRRYPATAVEEARNAGLPLSLACAILDQETGGGVNEFGHDPTIFAGAGEVTRIKYLAYKLRRGHTHMQGVGPVQLTWWSVQDHADALGGCWKPHINMRAGFADLAGLIHTFGTHDGIRRYNGSGSAAEHYATGVLARAGKWHETLVAV